MSLPLGRRVARGFELVVAASPGAVAPVAVVVAPVAVADAPVAVVVAFGVGLYGCLETEACSWPNVKQPGSVS